MHLRRKFVTQNHIMNQKVDKFNITLNIQQKITKQNVRLKLEDRKKLKF
jgi:hypothetical protein